MTEQEKAEKFAKCEPPLSKQEIDNLNKLFPAYIFRRSRTAEVWTSCCGRHEHLGESPSERAILYAEHQREPKRYSEGRPKPVEVCPFCGEPVVIKELGRTGRRDNLCNWKRAVILRWYRGALWARAYELKKEYGSEYELTAKPKGALLGVYRFRPGLAESTTRSYSGYPFQSISRQDGPLTGGRWHIHGPFASNAEYGVTYDVIGLDEIQKSPFKYCMPEEAEKRSLKFVQFLTACCFYPRQIEMLMKAGMLEVVRDFVDRGVKHAAVIDWECTDPKKVFGVSRQELKVFLGTNRDIKILELYKRLKGKADILTCAEWVKGNVNINGSARAAKKWNIPLERLLRYLNDNVGCARYGGCYSLQHALGVWEDYLTAAEALGYPLHRENVLLPVPLGAAHDSATTRHRQQLEREKEKEQKEKNRLAALAYKDRKKNLDKKYSYAADGYLIRVPTGKEEILVEGRKLKHCVAGYADRHMDGKLVILFMRKVNKPEESWLTIEMDGNRLVQIHGYRNEGVYTSTGRIAPNPREVYREFLDTWLDWLKKGSKRNEDGTPKMPRKKKGAVA